MNPDLQRLHPYPFERLATLLTGVQAPAALSPILMSIGEPRHVAPAFVLEEIRTRNNGYAQYPKPHHPGPARAARSDRRLVPAALWRAAGWLDHRRSPCAAGQWYPRSAVRLHPVRSSRADDGSLALVAMTQPVLPDLRRRGAARRRPPGLRQQRPGAQLRPRLASHRRRLATLPDAGGVFAREPHRRGA